MPIIGCLAFPNGYHVPSQSAELPDRRRVSQFVSGTLVGPIFHVSGWSTASPPAFVAVPKTAMNKDYRLDARQHKIRASRQTCLVQARFIARAPEPLLNRQFRFGAFGADGAHDSGAQLSRLCRLRFLPAQPQRHSPLPLP